MPSLLIIYDLEGWAFHREALALEKYAPPGYAVSVIGLPAGDTAADALGRITVPPDVLYVLPQSRPRGLLQYVRERGWPTKVVRGWSSGWPLRLPLYYDRYRDCHRFIINHEAYWRRSGFLPRAHMIPNGVDRDVFRVRVPIEQRSPKVLWCGSLHHREVKGYERFVEPLFAELESRGIACDALLVDSKSDEVLNADQMVDWYNTGTVLLCSSRAEGTPSVALEAASCGCTVVSTRVGNMEALIDDGVNGILVDRTLDSMRAGLLEALERGPELAARMQERIADWCWSDRSSQIFEVFDQALAESAPPEPVKRDLSAEVTVFVTTVGSPAYELCRFGLETQDTIFRLEAIENVAPMSAAYQQMHERCRTPYYIQLDEDMLLYPAAVGALYDRLTAAPVEVCCYVANLFDSHLDRMIHGVKIFRHGVVRNFPFRDVEGCDVDQFSRLQAAGFELRRAPVNDETATEGPPLGLHGPSRTEAETYDRYANLQRKLRRWPQRMRWFREYPHVFLERFLAEGREDDFLALMGTLSGRLADLSGSAEKDFRRTADPNGLEAALAFLRSCRPPEDS